MLNYYFYFSFRLLYEVIQITAMKYITYDMTN